MTEKITEKAVTEIYELVEEPAETVGLTKQLKFSATGLNYLDWIHCELDYLHHTIDHEFSEKDKSVLQSSMENLEKTKLNCILEIGIARSGEWSSTFFVLNKKKDNTTYIGVDMNPECVNWTREWNKSGVPIPNVHALVEDSRNFEKIKAFLNEKGFEEIDLLIIDGNHSADHIYRDFALTKLVRKGGHVLFHDTNYHPGPNLLFNCIDSSVFEAKKYFEKEIDWGVGTLIKL